MQVTVGFVSKSSCLTWRALFSHMSAYIGICAIASALFITLPFSTSLIKIVYEVHLDYDKDNSLNPCCPGQKIDPVIHETTLIQTWVLKDSLSILSSRA